MISWVYNIKGPETDGVKRQHKYWFAFIGNLPVKISIWGGGGGGGNSANGQMYRLFVVVVVYCCPFPHKISI